jgi:uncharacterized membrane protein
LHQNTRALYKTSQWQQTYTALYKKKNLSQLALAAGVSLMSIKFLLQFLIAETRSELSAAN